jgi:hypothetical protein
VPFLVYKELKFVVVGREGFALFGKKKNKGG